MTPNKISLVYSSLHILQVLILIVILALLTALVSFYFRKNSIGDAHTTQAREIVFNTMRYRRSETVKKSGYFQSKQCQQCQEKQKLY